MRLIILTLLVPALIGCGKAARGLNNCSAEFSSFYKEHVKPAASSDHVFAALPNQSLEDELEAASASIDHHTQLRANLDKNSAQPACITAAGDNFRGAQHDSSWGRADAIADFMLEQFGALANYAQTRKVLRDAVGVRTLPLKDFANAETVRVLLDFDFLVESPINTTVSQAQAALQTYLTSLNGFSEKDLSQIESVFAIANVRNEPGRAQKFLDLMAEVNHDKNQDDPAANFKRKIAGVTYLDELKMKYEPRPATFEFQDSAGKSHSIPNRRGELTPINALKALIKEVFIGEFQLEIDDPGDDVSKILKTWKMKISDIYHDDKKAQSTRVITDDEKTAYVFGNSVWDRARRKN